MNHNILNQILYKVALNKWKISIKRVNKMIISNVNYDDDNYDLFIGGCLHCGYFLPWEHSMVRLCHSFGIHIRALTFRTCKQCGKKRMVGRSIKIDR